MMGISIYHKAFKINLLPMAIFLLAWGVLLSACADSERVPSPAPDHTATLQLVFKLQGADAGSSSALLKGTESSASHAPLTMDAGMPTVDAATVPAGTTRGPITPAVETAIQTVDVLSFKADPADPTNIKKGTFFYRSKGEYTSTGTGQGQVQVKLLGSPEKQTLVVLANVRPQVDALNAAYGEQKEAVMNRLLLLAKANGTPDFTNGMPMWGELPAQTVNESYGQTAADAPTVTMIRSVVKVTLKSTDPPITHGFVTAYVYNHRTGGRISPDNYDRGNSRVLTPTVPAGTTPPTGTRENMNIPYNFGPGTVSFYLFESDSRSKVTATSALGTTCLVVEIKSTKLPEGAGIGYYRIDFKDYVNGQYLDLLRGHNYLIEVISIDGPPANTPEEAYKGNHTLKCRIVPWNEVQEEVKVPGNKRLTVDKRSIYLKRSSAVTTGETLTITTENTGGWSITDVPSWLTVSQTTSATDGTQNITVKSTGSSSFINSGSFKLKAGHAEMAIPVKLGKLPLEYVAEYNLAGGAQYGAKPNDASLVTSAQTDAALRWATSHANDQSGYYNWYVCKGVPNATYNPATTLFPSGKHLFSDSFFTSGAGKGYHLPSRWEWASVFSYGDQIMLSLNIDYDNINEACEFGGIKKTFASDYNSESNGICYALRFKQATDDPNDGSSTTDFPKATDNSMLCAYRYRRVGTLNSNNNTDRLEVDCVYLGSSFTGTINTISNDAWWNTQSDIPNNVVTRVFPAPGIIVSAPVDDLGMLTNRGEYGFYLSGTEDPNSPLLTWSPSFNSDYAKVETAANKHVGFAVRPFASD